MPNWRDELQEAVKTKAEREAEEAARHRKRVEEALSSAEAALALAADALKYLHERLREKGQPSSHVVDGHAHRVVLPTGGVEQSLRVELSPESAVLRVSSNDTKPREFDFAKDRHIAAADVEEYVGRRALDLVRAAQKVAPW